jgi:hypothetical protein
MTRTRKVVDSRPRRSIRKRAGVSHETFDEFLARRGLLEACEDDAIEEITAEQQAVNSLD